MSGNEDDHSVNFEHVPVPARPVRAEPVMPDPEATVDGAAPVRRVFAARADFRAAVDELLAVAKRTVRVFDPDLAEYGFNSPAQEEKLKNFLLASSANRLLIVVHDTTYITASCPRLMRLLRQFSHAIMIHQTHEAIRNVDDVLMVIDDAHYLRRPHNAQPNGVVVLHDPGETRGWMNRFNEIWEQSSPAVSATTIGL